ncbi:hypothetical protein MUK42_07864 [Musa troglodytarum]|uniref:Uncharacterized protein n=1 Tax=Musa troglodytarum TaxID=320322 RepID=A0A9E7E9Z1_9LILI|nr:hypothetical protein MUK42_07864 [Musa troglodytarum]
MTAATTTTRTPFTASEEATASLRVTLRIGNMIGLPCGTWADYISWNRKVWHLMNPQADVHAVTVARGDGGSEWLIGQPLHQSSDPITHCKHHGSQSSVVQECSDHLLGSGGHLSPSFNAKGEWKEETTGISEGLRTLMQEFGTVVKLGSHHYWEEVVFDYLLKRARNFCIRLQVIFVSYQMDCKKFLQLVEEKKKKILERKEGPLKWEQRLEAASKAKADAEAKKRKLKASRHKKRTHSGSDYDSDSDSSDSERKYRKKRNHKKHRKHDQSDSEDGGKRKHRSAKRSSSSGDHDSSDDDDAGRKRHTHGRKHRCSSGTDASSSPSSSEDDEKKANRKSHSRRHKHHHRSGDEDSTSDSQARRRHSKHKHHLRSSEDDSSGYDDHNHNRISSQGKSSGEEYGAGKPRDANKSHRKHGHHHHSHQKHNHHRCSVEPDVQLGKHETKTSAD